MNNKIKFFTLLICLCASSNLGAQAEGIVIETEDSTSVENLIKDIFIKGSCRNVSNITAIGDENLSIGQFSNGANIINVTDGIILSTGDIALARGPNDRSDASFAFNTESEDLDLSELATTDLFDVTGIEFEFVPISDKVTFRYVFASEEYCEYVGTSFNDVFGFFVSGPGINGPFDNNAISLAKLIGTDEDVSINTVNHLDNTNLYVNNVTNLDAEACNIFFSPEFEDFIEYDGFTIPLTASFSVVPCQTYRIRLVIGDVGDANLDSAVFLESNSFDLGEKVTVRAEVPGSDEAIAYESCVDGQFVFTRSSLSNLNEDCTVNYLIGSDSEAMNGVDFQEIPLSITIPAGDTSAVLPIVVIEDNILEGAESLQLGLTYDCDCIDPVFTELIIDEVDDFSANFAEISVCANQPFRLTPEIIGGIAPFSFLWETGATTDTLTANLSTAAQYAVTITDFCGTSVTTIANIGIQDLPTATLAGTYNLCEVIETGIPVELEGNPPWKIEYSIDGVEQNGIENIQSNPFYLPTLTEGIYEMIAFNDAYCEGNIIGNAIVESPIKIEAEIVNPTCFNSGDGSISINNLEAVVPFSIEWNVETDDDYLLENLGEGVYIITIVDGDGCFYEKNFDLNATSENIQDCSPVYVPNVFSPNNDGFNDVFSIYSNANSGVENILSFQVFNRWGGLVFEKNDFLLDNGATGWKGDFNGEALGTGIFVYQILVGFEDGSSLLLSGDIMLLR